MLLNKTRVLSKRNSISILFTLIAFSTEALAQLSNHKDTIVSFVTTRTIKLDSNSIVSGSLAVFDGQDTISPENYIIDYWNGRLKITKATSNNQVRVKYESYPFSFTKIYRHKDPNLYIQPTETKNPFAYKASSKSSLNSLSGLSKQGSISRGISFGNNQNIGVSSNLNLQLSGKISDEVSILAAITDENIPIQPEGNTQQLQDFDQVYIQLFNSKHKLTAGDFQLRENSSHYLKYFKKAQGISYEFNSLDTVKKQGLNVRASGAASRGKFSRYFLNQIEGQQGPYRLQGADNERFIIILSGTERIFIDGELLVRGVENDYIIDYNTSELTFTPNRLITKDKRIVVEFQYTDQNYVRTLAEFSVNGVKNNWQSFLKFYTEQDLKNQPINETITDEKRAFLEGLGDNVNAAIFSSEDSVGYSDNRVLYEKKDSLGYSIFEFSNNPNLAVYAVTFSHVNTGLGNYIQINSSANGKVFEWIKPDTINGEIIRNGTHEPVELISTPKQRQLLSTGVSRTVENGSIRLEGGFSKNDINTFSNVNGSDDYGFAGKIDVNRKQKLGAKLNAIGNISYEIINENFKEIEWFRSPEFARDWNLLNLTLTGTQHISNAQGSLQNKKNGEILTFANQLYISEKDAFKGNKNVLTTNSRFGKLSVVSIGSIMQSQVASTNTKFIRNKSTIGLDLGKLTIGLKDDYEKNIFTLKTDSLLNSSYEFLEAEAFLKNADSLNNNFYISYLKRTDKFPKNNQLLNASEADNINLNTTLFKNAPIKIKTRTTYRNLKIINSEVINVKPEETLLNRVEYTANLFKNLISSSSFYELGSGVEAKKEFVFIEVANGQGNFTWIDYDSSGTKELNEFETAVFQDQANYIKVFSPTNEFIKTKNNQFSNSLFIQPDRLIKNKDKWYYFIARFSNQLAYRIDWRSASEKLKETVNPFNQNIADSNLLGLNRVFRNTFFFNRKSPLFGANINYQSSGNKVLSTNGFEFKKNEFIQPEFRLKITKSFLLETKAELGKKNNTNDFFASRNFEIDYQRISPTINFQPSTNIRFSISYQNSIKKNKTDFGGETAISQSLETILRYSKAGSNNLEANIKYVEIDYSQQNGETPSVNSTIAFDMLEGLNPGKNVLWGANFQKTLSDNTQISILYSGRKPQDNKVIHNAGAEVRVFF